jgi:hypothetical protein
MWLSVLHNSNRGADGLGGFILSSKPFNIFARAIAFDEEPRAA